MNSQDSLAPYRAKRNVARSGEPTPEYHGSADRARGTGQAFVIQRHDATNLHFDFRLQIGDVLVSWSVPKGPATDPRIRRLAIRTEDHPLDYVDFEGRIPVTEYGGGTVIVWDTGRFDNLNGRSMAAALAAGHITVWLHGTKLSGAYSLLATQLGQEDGQEQWLLIKKADQGADRRRKPATTQPESALTGKHNTDLEQ